jgi:hypothetical protein
LQVIAWAAFQGVLTLPRAFEASRVEEQYNLRKYGHVSGMYGHDVDIEYNRQQLSTYFTYLNLLRMPNPAGIEACPPGPPANAA